MLNFENVVKYITKKKFEKYQKDPVALGNYVCSMLLENDDDYYVAEFCPGCNFADICKDAVDNDQKPIEYLGRWLLKEAKTPSYEEKLESIIGKELGEAPSGLKYTIIKDDNWGICAGGNFGDRKPHPMVPTEVLVNLLKAIEEVDNGT